MKRYSIGEVCSILDVPAHTLRYWEQEIELLRPIKNDGGHRSYTEADLQLLFRLKYLLYTRKFTVPGAREQLLADTGTPRSGLVAPIREIRSDLFGLLNTIQTMQLHRSRRNELPEVFQLRTDAAHLERVWRRTEPARRSFLSRELEQMPDFWVDHVRRLCAPGRLLNDTTRTQVRPTIQRSQLENQTLEPVDEHIRRGKIAVLWFPRSREDVEQAFDSYLSDHVSALYVGAFPDEHATLESFNRRRPTGLHMRYLPRYRLPVLSPDGHLQVDEQGSVKTAGSILAEAFACATLPQVRSQLMHSGAGTTGIIVGSPPRQVDLDIVAWHRQNHGSLSCSVRVSGTRMSLAGPVWCDLAFLSQAARSSGPAVQDGTAKTETVPDLRPGTLIHRAAVSHIIRL